jgi:hypothetical protein
MTELHTNPTQLTGLFAFALATLACGLASRRTGARTLWRHVAVLQALCLIEVVFGFRHRAHDVVDALLQANGWYADRRPLQVVLLAVVLMLAVFTFVALRRLRGAGPELWRAAVATAVALWLFVAEAVSLHGVDAVMYLNVGPVLLIGWCWVLCAAIVVWAATRTVMLRRESVPAPRR